MRLHQAVADDEAVELFGLDVAVAARVEADGAVVVEGGDRNELRARRLELREGLLVVQVEALVEHDADARPGVAPLVARRGRQGRRAARMVQESIEVGAGESHAAGSQGAE